MCGGREILIFNSDFSEFAWFNMGEVRDLPECEIALILVTYRKKHNSGRLIVLLQFGSLHRGTLHAHRRQIFESRF